jgi:glutamate--cysteine ligase
MSDLSQKHVTSIDELIGYYQQLNPDEKLYIGIELERSGVFRDTLLPVCFEGKAGYLAVFKRLIKEAGWKAIEKDGDAIYELQRGDTRISTEADGRPELSGSPKVSLHNLAREFRLHDNELQEIGNVFNIGWLPMGFQPFHANEDIPFTDKKRYQIVANATGSSDLALSHMKRTNGLAVNFSYTNEENLIRKAQTAFRITPIVAAMFASSPFEKGKLSGFLDMRRHVNANWAPERTSIPSTILESSFSIEEWIRHYFSIPLILICKKGQKDKVVDNLFFEQWINDGYEDTEATSIDFDQHVRTLWSDLRLRPGYLEYRVADSVPSSMAMALTALIKGLVFDSSSWDAVEELTKGWTYERVKEIDEAAWKTGLQTEVDGKLLLTYAQQLTIIANDALHRFARTDVTDVDESIFLAPLKEQIFIKEKSPAEELVALYEGEWNGDLSRIIEWCETDKP